MVAPPGADHADRTQGRQRPGQDPEYGDDRRDAPKE